MHIHLAKFCCPLVVQFLKTIESNLLINNFNHTNTMKKALTILVILTLGASLSYAQKGYRFEVRIDGLKDTTLLLGYHLGDKKFVADTAKVNSKGVAIFESDTLLHGGMYIVILPQRSYFDFLVSNNQRFSMHTQIDNLLDNLKFTGSPENTAFLGYQQFMNEKQKTIGEIRNKLQNVTPKSDSEKELMDQMAALDQQVKANWDRIIKENPGTFLASIISSLKPIDIPEFNIPSEASNPDSLRWVMSYTYNQKHYLDNINLSDDRLMRTPFFQHRLDFYFDKVLLPIPDTIKLYVDKVIERTASNNKMYQYVLSQLLTKYQSSNIMGMDAVFVHIAEKYYLSGRAKWLSADIIDKIRTRVNELKPNLIGNTAPNFRMTSLANRVIDLHSIKAKATILYFWEPSCSHCKKVTPILREKYEQYKSKGLEVVAVYTQGDMPKWKEYVDNNKLTWINVWDANRATNYHKLYDIYSTPVIYVLDADKKIVAKRIGIESLDSILEGLLK